MAAWKAIPSSSSSSSSGPRSPDPISVALQQWPRPSSSLSPPKSLPTSPPLQPAGSGSSVDSYGATLYKTELCRSFADTGYCRYGLKCRFAHGSVDLRPVTRHKKYKTERCKNYVKDGSCPYGPRCRFVHEPDEALQLIEDTGSPPSPDLGPSSPGDDQGSPPLRSSGSVGIAMGRQVPSSSPGHAVIGTPGRSPVFGGHIAAGSPYLSGGLGGLAVPPVLNLSGSAAASSSSMADRALLSPHAAAAQAQAANERRGRALSDLPANGTNGGSVYGRYEDNGRVMPPSGSSAGRAIPRSGERDRDGSLFAAPVFNPQPVNTVFGFDPTPSPSGQQSLLAGTFALPRSPSPPPLPSPTNTGLSNGNGNVAISYHHHDVQMTGVGARGVFTSHASSHHYSALTTQLHSRDEVLFTQTTSMAHPIPMRGHHRGPQEHHAPHHHGHGHGHGHGHHVGHPDMISREPSVVSEDGMERLGQDLGRVLDGASPVAGNPNGNPNGNGNTNEESSVVAPAPRRVAPRAYMGVSSSLPLALEAQGHVPPQPRFNGNNTGALGAPSTWPSLSSASVPSTPATGPRAAPTGGVAARPVYLGGATNGAPDSLAAALRRQLHVSRQTAGGDDNSANEDDINNDSSSVHDHDDDITSASPDHEDDSNNDGSNHNGANGNGNGNKSRHQQLFVSKAAPSSVKQASMNIRPL